MSSNDKMKKLMNMMKQMKLMGMEELRLRSCLGTLVIIWLPRTGVSLCLYGIPPLQGCNSAISYLASV
jgi:hypothetical protein